MLLFFNQPETVKEYLPTNAGYRGVSERKTLPASIFQDWLSARRRAGQMLSAKTPPTELAIYTGKLC